MSLHKSAIIGLLSNCCTDGDVGSHVVAVVKADKGQVGHMRCKDQDEQDSHHAGHPRSPQTQSSGKKEQGT